MQVFTISQIQKNMGIVHVTNFLPIFWKHETWVEVVWKFKNNLAYKLLVNAQVRGFFFNGTRLNVLIFLFMKNHMSKLLLEDIIF
jgi:hypothetical protein